VSADLLHHLPGLDYVWSTDAAFGGTHVFADLLRGTDGAGVSGGSNYYLPARTPLPPEAYYP